MSYTYVCLTKEEKQYIFDNFNKKSTKEMAEWIGCNVATIRYHLNKKGLKPERFSKWSPARRDELLNMRKRGATISELATIFNTTKQSIFGQMRKMRESGVNVPTEWDIRLVKKNC